MNDRQSQANEVGRVPSEEFKCWLKKVEEVQKIAEEMAHKVGGERKQCFTWFSDLGSRYSLGKKAVKKKALIDELLQEKLDNISLPMRTQVIKPLFNKDFKVYQSTKLALQKVMDALKNDGVHIIGLSGMGGVGKTTLAKEIKRQALEQNMFRKAIMVTISQNPNLDIIREKMAEQLGINIKQESISLEKLFSLIKPEGQVLIILDDVWRRLDLSEIGIPHDCCKIIMTSRSLEVCTSMGIKENIQLGFLSPEDSWELFKAYSEVVESSSELQCCVARDVASECKGLPLAIATVGRALRGKSFPEWEDALVQLRASVPDNISELKDVYMQLKLSYDHLSKEAQSCFLLCSLFPEDAVISVELLTCYAMGEGFLQCVNTLQETKNRVLSLVSKLKASCLLLEEGEEGKMVKMHDVVRDVAIYIGSNENHEGCLSKSYQNEPNWDKWETVKECKRLSVMNQSICTLPEKPPECSYVQTLLLQWNLELIKIPDKFFEKMTSLRGLDLRWTSISSLPASMSYLTNLQVILLDHCNLLVMVLGLFIFLISVLCNY
ncbi:putative disease resistance protein [Acorus gramineus]|uniref:Disease resistance protein n=1 Tax=Acorus gramineus TaxID=55184 RepID=A0AAV9BTP4_ACOGR|nr:putative disease resistance protein [Acorus gramineus]